MSDPGLVLELEERVLELSMDLRAGSERQRRLALQELAHIGGALLPARLELESLLRASDDGGLRLRTMETLAEHVSGISTLPGLLARDSYSSDPLSAILVFRLLSALGHAPGPCGDVVHKLLHDNDHRDLVVIQLIQMGHAGRAAEQDLREIINSESGGLPVEEAVALWSVIGRLDKAALRVLETAVKSEVSVRRRVTRALQIGSHLDLARAASLVRRLASDGDARVRAEAQILQGRLSKD